MERLSGEDETMADEADSSGIRTDKTDAEFIADCERMLAGGSVWASWEYLLEKAIERLTRANRNIENLMLKSVFVAAVDENTLKLEIAQQRHQIAELKELLRYAYECAKEDAATAGNKFDEEKGRRITEILGE